MRTVYVYLTKAGNNHTEVSLDFGFELTATGDFNILIFSYRYLKKKEIIYLNLNFSKNKK